MTIKIEINDEIDVKAEGLQITECEGRYYFKGLDVEDGGGSVSLDDDDLRLLGKMIDKLLKHKKSYYDQ